MKTKGSQKNRAALIVASLFGVGYLSPCPGTFASLLALACFFLIPGMVYFAVFCAVSLFLAFSLSGPAEAALGQKDAKQIVIDDFAGMLITYLFIPHDIRLMIAGFFLFRMFDMLKIPPADCIEKMPGAKGVVGDDVVAGVYANVTLQLLRFLPGV